MQYLWHSTSLQFLYNSGLLNDIAKINGSHYISDITRNICKENNINTNNICKHYFIDKKKFTGIGKYVKQVNHKKFSKEDTLLYILLKRNQDIKVVVLGNGCMSDFNDELRAQRIKLFDLLVNYHYFKQYDIACKLYNTAKSQLNLILLKYNGFNKILNIALGQEQG